MKLDEGRLLVVLERCRYLIPIRTLVVAGYAARNCLWLEKVIFEAAIFEAESLNRQLRYRRKSQPGLVELIESFL